MTRPYVRRIGLALVAGAAGAALNLTPIPALARLWPGRIATLPVAIFYGPWYGALASIIASLALWLLVHHTTFGRSFRAIGFSPEGARYAGLPVEM